MLNFKTYEEAIEFHRNNHPLQTRTVLVEKYSSLILMRESAKFLKEVLNKKAPTSAELERLLAERRSRIFNLLKIDKPNINSGTVYVTSIFEYTAKTYKNDSDFTSIYELF